MFYSQSDSFVDNLIYFGEIIRGFSHDFLMMGISPLMLIVIADKRASGAC